MKRGCLKSHALKTIILLLMIQVLLLSSALEENSKDNIEIDFRSLDMLRDINSSIPISITISNLNDYQKLDVKKMTIYSGDKKIMKIKNFKNKLFQKFKPLKDYKKREEELSLYLQSPKACETSNTLTVQSDSEEYEEIKKTIKEETLEKDFYLDINDFILNPKIGDTIDITLVVEFKIGWEKYEVSKKISIKVAEPLPVPLQDVSKWFKGDLHIHSDAGETYLGLFESADSIPQMTKAAISNGLDWVIFTDHSPGIDTKEHWEQARDECFSKSTETFKCLYGQEMSIGKTENWCDALHNGHYLTHPYFNDDYDWINGDCGFGECECRDEQSVLDEIIAVGGLGSVAHPYMPSTTFTSFDWDNWSVSGISGIEIINKHFGADDLLAINNPSEIIDSWSEFLNNEINPVNGFVRATAGSDAHEISDVGASSFNYCYLDSGTLTTSAIRNSVSGGHCIVTTGPFVSFTLSGNNIGDIAEELNQGVNSINIQAVSNEQFGELNSLDIYVGEKLQRSISLSGFSYLGTKNVNIKPSDSYIRLELRTDSQNKERPGIALTNPIWINVRGTSINNSKIPLFKFKGTDSKIVASFLNNGGLNLKGECFISNNCMEPENSMVFQNNNKETVAYIDFNGNLCLENGQCVSDKVICNPSEDAFIVQDDLKNNLSYMDFSGSLCLTGGLNENVIF